MHENKRFGFAQFRFVVAAILLLAAGLKAHQLSAAPLPPVVQGSVFTPMLELLNDRYFLMVVVVGEILFALVLIAGIWRQWMWLLSLLGFTAFMLVSLIKGLSGESSCHCFGAVTTSPWITTFLDLAIVILLAIFRERIGWKFAFPDRKKLVTVLIAWIVLAGTALFAMLSLKQEPHATLGTEFIGVDGKSTIMLEPERWVDQRFPLWDYVDDKSRSLLEKGEWNIVIGRKQCDECKQLIEKLGTHSTIPVALIEVDDDATDTVYSEPENVPVKGWLTFEPHWLILMPCLIKCRDGVCVSVGDIPAQE
ncbi:MAG: hypothetical protein FWH27_17050 [Planctomycetaceae bacterium]|nr:hypothetical protein [Planctomycetaceae bacterium]